MRIQHLGMLCVLMVAFIHGTTFRFCPAEEEGGLLDDFSRTFQSTVAFRFARVAVPYFFLISGFLFFRGLDSLAQIPAKLHRRFYGLVVPYLCWSGIWLIAAHLLVRLNLDPNGSFGEVVSASPTNLLNTWLLDPIPGQLWFVRDLISLSLLSPLILLGLRGLGFLLPATTMILWFTIPENVVIELRQPWEFISLTGISMFTIGAWLSRRKPPELNEKSLLVCSGTLWVAVVAITLLNPIPQWAIENAIARLILDRFGILCGLLSMWAGYRYLQFVFEHPAIEECSKHTFFIYAAHYPLLGFLVACGIKMFGCSAACQIMIFLIAPLLVVSLLSVIAAALSAKMPLIYGILSGYRGVDRRAS